MRYVTVKEMAEKWNLTERCVQSYCVNEKIAGVKQIGKQWLIPCNAEQPADGRKSRAKGKLPRQPYRFPVFIYSPFYNLTTSLSESELKLLEAQRLHLEGRYVESISICRELLKDAVPPYLQMGVYCTIGFNALLLGMQSDFKHAIAMMGKISATDETQAEDYKLILLSLKYHAELNSSVFSDIDPAKLSTDALIYYKNLLLLATLLTGSKIGPFDIRYFNADCQALRQDGVIPALFGCHCFLAIVNNLNGCETERDCHINAAASIAVENGWISHLAKYYCYAPAMVERALLPYGKKAVAALLDKVSVNVRNWKIMHRIESGNCKPELFTPAQCELLLLVSYGYSSSKIAQIKGLPVSKINKEIDILSGIAKVRNKKELEQYSKKNFDAFAADEPSV